MNNNYSINKEKEKNKETTTPAVDDKKVTAEVEADTKPDVVAPAEDETNPEPEVIVGIVSGCARLRVRKTPSPNAPVLTEIVKGSEVAIDESKSTVYFYAVVTDSGVEGFCMKEYIQVR